MSRPPSPSMTYSSEDDHVEGINDVCPICLVDDAVNPRITTCGHVFCAECLERAFMERLVCPLCRRPQGESGDGWLQSEATPMPDREEGSAGYNRSTWRTVRMFLTDREYRQGVIAEERLIWRAALGGPTQRH
jgi:hypothetical protein